MSLTTGPVYYAVCIILTVQALQRGRPETRNVQQVARLLALVPPQLVLTAGQLVVNARVGNQKRVFGFGQRDGIEF